MKPYMTDQEIEATFRQLWKDIHNEGNFPNKRPLLAHYTSISTLESIMRNDEVWFSNPLFMNDLDELNFVMAEAAKEFRESAEIKNACPAPPDYYEQLRNTFEDFFYRYISKHVFDTYIFSLSEHKPENKDGLLSMWRGYGGNGHGAAIVFDTEKIEFVDNSPLIVASVIYASNDERRKWIKQKMSEFATLIKKSCIPTQKLYIPIHQLFERIKVYALFSKHDGFKEEAEWRIAFLKERDINEEFESMFSYAIGRNGVEPKLKLKIAPIKGYSSQDLSLEKIVNQIILGPMMASPLAVKSVQRMLHIIKKSSIADKVIASTTPYRPH